MHDINYYFECDRPQTLVEGGLGVASHPGPSKGGGTRAWYTLHAHAPGDPRKMWGIRILLYTLHLYDNAMETPAHACAVCTRPFLLLLKGLGTRLGFVLQVAQWYYSSGVSLLYLLVFYHCIHNSQSISPFLHSNPLSNSKTMVDLGKLLISEPDGMFH